MKVIWTCLACVFVIAYVTSVAFSVSEYIIKRQTYVSTLQQTYDQNVEACREAVNKANEQATEAQKKSAVKTTCIDKINSDSREAKLLKSWGSSELLRHE